MTLLLALWALPCTALPHCDTLRWEVGQSSEDRARTSASRESSIRQAPSWREGFYGGLTVGAAFSQVDGDGHSGFHRVNALASAWVGYDWHRHWGLRLDFRYLGKGSHAVSKQKGDSRLEYDLQLHYFELPFQLQYRPIHSFTLGAGLALGYLIAYQERNAYGDLAISRGAPKRYEFSGLVSLTWRFYRGLGVRGGWQYSILPIRGELAKSSMEARRGQFNNLLFLALDYRF